MDKRRISDSLDKPTDGIIARGLQHVQPLVSQRRRVASPAPLPRHLAQGPLFAVERATTARVHWRAFEPVRQTRPRPPTHAVCCSAPSGSSQPPARQSEESGSGGSAKVVFGAHTRKHTGFAHGREASLTVTPVPRASAHKWAMWVNWRDRCSSVISSASSPHGVARRSCRRI